MTQDRSDEEAELANEAASDRPPYLPPAVIWEESIDRGAMLAAACGKNDGYPTIQCGSAPAS